MVRTKSSNKFDFRILVLRCLLLWLSVILILFHCRLTQSTNQRGVTGRPPSIGTEGLTGSIPKHAESDLNQWGL